MDCKNLVIKHNKLVEAQGRMTAMEQKFVLGVVSQITPHDEDFKEYEITINEMVNVFGIDQKNVYRVVDETANSIMNRPISIREEGFTLHTRMFSSAKYIDGEGVIRFKFDPDLKPYLLQLSEHFTKYELENIVNIPSSHAIRVYELLKQYQTIGKRTFETSELRACLGLENNYKAFKDFEKRVLKVAEKEINKHTDLQISYEKIKRGRKIAKIEFTIKKNYSEKEQQQQQMKELSEAWDNEARTLAIKSGLKDLKINETQFYEIYKIANEQTNKFDLDPCEYIKLNYEYMLTKNDIISPVAYLKAILKEDGGKARIKMLGL